MAVHVDLPGPGFRGTLLFGKLLVLGGEKWFSVVRHEKGKPLRLVFCSQGLNQGLPNLLIFRRPGICGTQGSSAQDCHCSPRSGFHA